MQYKVVAADSAAELEAKVQALLDQGWQIQGGASCSYGIEHTAVECDGRGFPHPKQAVETVFHELWSQAMVRDK